MVKLNHQRLAEVGYIRFIELQEYMQYTYVNTQKIIVTYLIVIIIYIYLSRAMQHIWYMSWSWRAPFFSFESEVQTDTLLKATYGNSRLKTSKWYVLLVAGNPGKMSIGMDIFSKCLENVHFRKVSGEISENGRLIFLKKPRWIRRVPVNRHCVGSKRSLKLQDFWDEDLHRQAVGYLEILQVDTHKHCGWLRLLDGHWTTTGGCSPKDGQNTTMQFPNRKMQDGAAISTAAGWHGKIFLRPRFITLPTSWTSWNSEILKAQTVEGLTLKVWQPMAGSGRW